MPNRRMIESYDFLEVLTKTVLMSWLTLVLPHFGHFTRLRLCSSKVIFSVKVFLHCVHSNS